MGEANKKSRPCPVTQTIITSLECGTNRGTKYACPNSCPFYPLAPISFEALENLDEELEVREATYARTHARNRQLEKVYDRLMMTEGDRDEAHVLGLVAATQYILYQARSPFGPPLIEKWRSGLEWSDLSNDEKHLASFRATTRNTVIEVKRVCNDLVVECFDLFDPENRIFRVFDRLLAAHCKSADRIFCALMTLPYFTRIRGLAIPVPSSVGLDLIEHINSLSTQASQSPQEYLLLNWSKVMDWAYQEEERRITGYHSRLNVRHFQSVWSIKLRLEEVQAILAQTDFKQDQSEELQDDVLAEFLWCESKEPGLLEPEESDVQFRSVVSFSLYEGEFDLETYTDQDRDIGKEMVMQIFGDSIELLQEQEVT